MARASIPSLIYQIQIGPCELSLAQAGGHGQALTGIGISTAGKDWVCGMVEISKEKGQTKD